MPGGVLFEIATDEAVVAPDEDTALREDEKDAA